MLLNISTILISLTVYHKISQNKSKCEEMALISVMVAILIRSV